MEDWRGGATLFCDPATGISQSPHKRAALRGERRLITQMELSSLAFFADHLQAGNPDVASFGHFLFSVLFGFTFLIFG